MKGLFKLTTSKSLHAFSPEFVIEKTLNKLTKDLSTDINLLDALLNKVMTKTTLYRLIKLLKESYNYKFDFDSKELNTELGLTSYFFLPEIYQQYISTKGKTVIPNIDPDIKHILDEIIKSQK
jgi:hypothetical protein